jgi:sensor c-di-GMP phosphodiesterase-like protein
MSQLIDELKRSNNHPNQGDEGKPELSMSELLSGMVNREFFFHHQPIIDLHSGIPVGSEMLIRWVRRGEVLAPMWFMPMIERHGLNRELDKFVIDRFAEIPWPLTVKPDYRYRVFINVSAQSFIDPDFTICVMKAMENMQVNSVIPVLELSERNSCEIEFFKTQIKYLHDRGVEIALDDFGVGYSSISRLIELPIDILKIDRSIISQIGYSDRAESITQAIFKMANDLGMKIVAEGVETETQSNWLVKSGQCWAQGFYYARPTLVGFIGNAENSATLISQDTGMVN